MTPGGLCFANSIAILANAAEPQFTERDLRGAPRVPDWGDFQDYAAGLSHDLFDQLEAALAAGKPLADLEEIRKQIEDLGNQVRVAGLVMGLMIPFKPKPKKTGFIAFGPWLSWRGIRTLFPWMDAAIDFLTKKKVVPASEFSSLSMDQQQAAFTAPGMEDKDELRKLRDEIAKGQNQEQGGESLADFRKRIADQVSLTRAQTETVFRTNVKQGLVDGFQKSMKSELVSELFPAVLFSATADNRVRETHWELDGFVCLKTDPAYKVLLRAIKDWNCRCSLIPLSLEDAKAEPGGIRTIGDLRAFHPKVIAKYGQGV